MSLFGIANYLPQRDTGDTDDSINDMMKLMVEEDRRMKPDLGRISDLYAQDQASSGGPL